MLVCGKSENFGARAAPLATTSRTSRQQRRQKDPRKLLRAIKEHPDEQYGELLLKLAGRGSHGTRSSAIATLGLPVYRKSLPGLAKYLTERPFNGYAINTIVKAQGKDSLPLLMSELEKS
ncbi:MAG: hypothetical protein IH991_20490, partial [Planctomycetes bacterium]|nr:hypothetical protein [Planctomycetota bacterium]